MHKIGLLAGLVVVGFSGTSSHMHEPGGDLLGEAFGGVAFGDSVADVAGKLEDQCDELKRTVVEQPYFPLARDTQTHLVALNVFTAGVEEAAFTFADDALVLVEARGGAVDGLWGALEEEPLDLAGYGLRVEARTVAHSKRDAVWLLGPGALHPHLYLWENPDLPSVVPGAKPFDGSAARPPMLAFGGKLEALLPRMKKASEVTERQEIQQPWLPTEPAVQIQINCYGVVYAGFPRKIEAVFGDDELQLAWILTGAGEEARMRRALVEAFGEPVFVSKNWEAFDDWRVALRKDKPEVLMLAEELVPSYKEQIEAERD